MTRRTKQSLRSRRYVPAFVPVPLRARTDGWSARRQAVFLGYLAETGSVAEAARRVGMARETAYRLRARPGAESFAAAWDVALGKGKADTHRSRKVTGYELEQRAFAGVLKPMLYAGRFTGIARKTDNTALLRLVAQPHLALAGRGQGAEGKSQLSRAVSCHSSGAGRQIPVPRRDPVLCGVADAITMDQIGRKVR